MRSIPVDAPVPPFIDASLRRRAYPKFNLTARARQLFVVPPLMALLIGVLLPINTLTLVEEDISWVGRASIVITLLTPLFILAGYLAPGRSIDRRFFRPILCFAALGVLYLPRRGSGDETNWIPLVQITLLGGFFIALSTCAWPRSSLFVLKWIAQLFVIATLAGWASEGYPTPYYGYYENSNSHGAVLAHLFGLSMLPVRLNKSLIDRAMILGWTVAATFAVGATVSRASLLAILAGVGVFALWPLLCRHRKLYGAIFLGLIGSIGIVILLQTVFLDQVRAQGYNDLSYNLTGKNFSTRSLVWQPIIDVISAKPLLGQGPGIDIAEVIDARLSAHSLYLQVTAQVGLVGLTALLVLLHWIWSTLWTGRFDPVVRVAGAVFIAMLLHQAFEVSLTQNNLAIGMIVWLIAAIGISRSLAIAPSHSPTRLPITHTCRTSATFTPSRSNIRSS
jgi:O-antigen ligase